MRKITWGSFFGSSPYVFLKNGNNKKEEVKIYENNRRYKVYWCQ